MFTFCKNIFHNNSFYKSIAQKAQQWSFLTITFNFLHSTFTKKSFHFCELLLLNSLKIHSILKRCFLVEGLHSTHLHKLISSRQNHAQNYSTILYVVCVQSSRKSKTADADASVGKIFRVSLNVHINPNKHEEIPYYKKDRFNTT